MKCNYFLLVFLVVMCCLANIETKDVPLMVEVVAGQSAELPCNVTADDPDDRLTVLLWYRNGTDTAIYGSRDLRGKARDMGGGRRRGRYRVVQARDETYLLMADVRADDAGLYYCYADFDVNFAHKTYVQLVVILPPERLWVIWENGTSVGESISTANHDLGPLHIGDQLRLSCVVFGGKPRPNLTWWTGGMLLKDTSIPLSERRVRSLLTYGPLRRKDHGRVLTCRAANSKHVDPLSIDITLDIYLPPELVNVRGPAGAVRAGSSVTLQCRVLGARPPPDIVWRVNGERTLSVEQNITVESSQRLVVSDVEMNATAEYDEAHVTCCASAHDRHDTYVCADNFTLSVIYPPMLEIITEKELLLNDTISVVAGSNVTLNCIISANPATDNYFWYHQNEKISEVNDTSHSIQLHTTLQFNSIEEEAAGEYKCGAVNAEGESESRPLIVDVQYPATCTKDKVEEYGVGKNSINISCEVKANPDPTGYRWVFINGTNATDDAENFISELDGTAQILIYNRPSDVVYGTILCWGLNDVPDLNGASEPCKFIITDETVPQPPRECKAVRNEQGAVNVTCEEGHNGGLQQKFILTAKTLNTNSEITSITNVMAPKFIVDTEPEEAYELIILAVNDKGESEVVVINQEDIMDKEIADMAEPVSAVANITTLSLALCSGVALLALLACGLVLCAHERATSAELPRPPSTEPPLCAYNTEESNCETWVDSDDGSECQHVRRSGSFRRSSARHSPRHVRRSSSFNARGECRQSKRSACRVHSLQNINRRREMDILCDHLAGYLPADTHYSYHKNPTVFYTMPRKQRHSKKLQKDNSDEAQNSDGFSLPPPPDEFGSYRAGTRITARDMPAKPAYAALGQPVPGYPEIRTEPLTREPAGQHYNNVIISPMNTVGLPTGGGGGGAQPGGLYNYPEDESQGTNTQRVPTLSTFQTNYARESGF